MANLLSLPEDILLIASSYLHITDVLSLKQTCRVLHVFGYSDHLWRLMIRRFDLPLDVGPEDRTDDMTGRELQALAIKAIKLQENWAKSEPSVKTLTKAIHRDNDKFVESMDLLPGGQWLVTYQRGRTSSRVALWSLHDLARIHRSASLDFPRGKYFFAVGLQQNGDATLAITTGTKKHRELKMYQLPLREYMNNEYSAPVAPPLIYAWSGIADIGHICRRSLCNSVIASPVIQWAEHGVIADATPVRIFFANASTGVTQLIDPKLPETLDVQTIQVALYPQYIAISGILRKSFIVYIYRLPPSMLPEAPQSAYAIKDAGTTGHLGPLIYRYQVGPLQGSRYELDISGGRSQSLNYYSLIILDPPSGYPLNSSARPTDISRHQYPLRLSDDDQAIKPSPIQFSYRALMRHHAYVIDAVCHGVTGHRAVWIEFNVDKEKRKLIKTSTNTDGPVVDILVATDPALPFTPAECHTLAFDEATGRVCVGLYEGELYILDY